MIYKETNSDFGFFKEESSHLSISKSILEADFLSPYEKIVYLYLTLLSDRYEKVYPTYQTIADGCHISRTAVFKAIQNLVELGLVEKKLHNRSKDLFNNLNFFKIVDYVSEKYLKNIKTKIDARKLEKKKNKKKEKKTKNNSEVRQTYFQTDDFRSTANVLLKNENTLIDGKFRSTANDLYISYNNTNNLSINNKEIDNNKIRSTEPAKMKKIKYAKKENSISGNSKNKTSALDQFQKLRQTESKSNTRKETIEKFKKYPSKRFISWKIKEPLKWNKLEMVGFYLSTWLEFSKLEDPEFKRNSRFQKESHFLGLFVEKYFDGDKEEFKKYTLWCFDFIFNNADSRWIQNAGFYKIYANNNNIFWKTFKTSSNPVQNTIKSKREREQSFGDNSNWTDYDNY